jgi:hypothetical protein
MEANAGQVAQAPAAQPNGGPAAAPLVAPNQYHLAGHGLTISYFPEGRGPIGPAGATKLIYQDAHQTLSFPGDQVREVDVPDLGTLLSVTIVRTVDIGSTSFTLLLPAVQVPDTIGASVHVQTEGITTTHRIFAGLIGHAQAESYAVTKLSGMATHGILPF